MFFGLVWFGFGFLVFFCLFFGKISNVIILENLRENSNCSKFSSLQESNVEGALTLTKEALKKSQDAKQKVEMVSLANGLLTNSETQRKATERLMDKTRTDYTSTQSENQGTLDNIITQIEHLEEKIPGLSKQVCDGETSVEEPCDR